MYLLLLLSVLFLGTFGAPTRNTIESFIVNELLDETLNKINNDASIDGNLKINSIILGDYYFKNGHLNNVKSLKRSGDASMWSTDKKISVSGNLMLEEMVFTANTMTFQNNVTASSPIIKVKQNGFSFLFEAELDTKSGCKITGQSISWDKLDGTLFSDNIDFNNITFVLNNSQLAQLNGVATNNEGLLEFLKNNLPVCTQFHNSEKSVGKNVPKVVLSQGT